MTDEFDEPKNAQTPLAKKIADYPEEEWEDAFNVKFVKNGNKLERIK